MKDKRHEPRSRSFLKGRIIFNGGKSSFDCLIRDISTSGARLDLADAPSLPDAFDLEIPHKRQTVPARLRWMRDGHVGVQFMAVEPDRLLVSIDSARRLKDLKAENTRLQRLIQDLRIELGKAPARLRTAS